ncbi:putative GUN4 domain containing protein [Halomicronema hongdechloris C2206]|uniref:GUN4 domain containing protein n=1 Tax=Halomicronema hongdechloris C2206 TaxID=1641165 RepID=A0A1Z3HG05_9CYAN|nr:toll/interleukin-1 receptor domain-containing protein [Halomicronema hongdechloris]ASC69216.1 putative GUN4 domain containing protein [Halomicronema hongdechloris C2206]
MAHPPLNVFISYSHRDEALKAELEVHLSPLKRQRRIQPWQDRQIEAGTEWNQQILNALDAADIILLLISPQFINSEFCFDKEMQRALQRHQHGTARVIPIILRPTDWQDSPFGKLQVLPKDGQPITRWDDRDEAFLNVVRGIRRAVDTLAPAAAAADDGWATPPNASSPSSPSSNPGLTIPQDRLGLYKFVQALPVTQFDSLIFVLNPPKGNVPPASAALGQRVAALFEWLESPIGPGLDSLRSALSQVITDP